MTELGPDEQTFAQFDLELLDTREMRSWDAEELWQTARHKTNRIALGVPRWSQESGDNDWTLNLDLTLVPDEACRFRSAEVSFAFAGRPGDATELPVVRSLSPAELHDEELAVSERSGSMTASVKVTLPVSPGAELTRTSNERVETKRTMVWVASFGVGTSKAGWRLRLTNARDIPLSMTDLSARISSSAGFGGELNYSVVAQIDVLTTLDRWLTAAFVDKAGGLRRAEPFPPGSQISAATRSDA